MKKLYSLIAIIIISSCGTTSVDNTKVQTRAEWTQEAIDSINSYWVGKDEPTLVLSYGLPTNLYVTEDLTYLSYITYHYAKPSLPNASCEVIFIFKEGVIINSIVKEGTGQYMCLDYYINKYS
jgi:hypothetical protein